MKKHWPLLSTLQHGNIGASTPPTVLACGFAHQKAYNKRIPHHYPLTMRHFSYHRVIPSSEKNHLQYKCSPMRKDQKCMSGLNKMFVQMVLQIKKLLRRDNMQRLLSVFFSVALMLLMPLKSNASSATQPSSAEYYLQNSPRSRESSSKTQGRILSIQTKSTLASSPIRHNSRGRLGTQRPERKTTQRIAAGFVVVSLAAASFRAKFRKSKIVRTATPFGFIRNTSPLGNGVSVIRLRMALEFEGSDDTAAAKAETFLEKLQVEEYNLYATITMLAQKQKQLGLDVYELRQKALVHYLASVATLFSSSKQSIKYGSMISARVPFVEEAVTEFKSISDRERSKFKPKKEPSILISGHEKQLVVASIILAIKGDHTTSPFQSGISSKKDMGRALLRIATDAQVDGCLVGTEVMWMPRQLGSCDVIKENEVLKQFSDLADLT
jgi:hypothetical protein